MPLNTRAANGVPFCTLKVIHLPTKFFSDIGGLEKQLLLANRVGVNNSTQMEILVKGQQRRRYRVSPASNKRIEQGEFTKTPMVVQPTSTAQPKVPHFITVYISISLGRHTYLCAI
nr:hypothetical protein L203_04937 [Cryptococcus depauperatus CBS 7841]